MGAILALFGFYITFRIQNIKTVLNGIGKSVQEVIKYKKSTWGQSINGKRYSKDDILERIERACLRQDIIGLKDIIEALDFKNSDLYRRRYNLQFSTLQNHKIYTIIWSIFTAEIIILCLLIIPFGDLIDCHSCLLYFMFIYILIGVSIIFSGLIFILVKSFKESRYKPYFE